MDTAIGAGLGTCPRRLCLTTLAAVILVSADLAFVAFGSVLGLDYSLRFTLALAGSLLTAFLSAADPAIGGSAFGFRIVPRQGWRFWIRATAMVGAVLFVILLCYGIGFVALGYRLPEPRIRGFSQLLPLFLWMCITAPLAEEVLYRLVFCPPCTALLGAPACILLNGMTFAALHVIYGNPSPENLLGGFVLCWAFLKSETLIIPIALHAGGNLCAFLANVAYYCWWQAAS